MTRAAYTGHETLTFSDYLDLDTGGTLTAEPGGVYDVAPAGGPVPDIPEGWFVPAGPEERAARQAAAEAARLAAESAAGEAPPEAPAEPMENLEALGPQQEETQQPEDGPQQ